MLLELGIPFLCLLFIAVSIRELYHNFRWIKQFAPYMPMPVSLLPRSGRQGLYGVFGNRSST